MQNLKFAVIGAGAGGTLMAIQLKTKGYVVKLMDQSEDVVNKMKSLGALKATGKTEAQATPDLITTDIVDCIKDTDVIMVCTTTDAHVHVASQIAQAVKAEQIVVLNPGHLGGVLEFQSTLIKAGCADLPMVGEASDLMYACRTLEIGHTFHSGVKAHIKLASIPSQKAQLICNMLSDVFPCFEPAANVFITGLSGGGGLLHSIPCVMNINKVELGQTFDYYIEGLTPGICHVIEQADRERVAVCLALGVEAEPLLQHLKSIYQLDQDNLYDAIQNCVPYKGIKSPLNSNHRFFQEDTLNDLVPTASIGKLLGIPTPTIDAIILIESAMLGKDFIKDGRTVEKLGLDGKSAEEILELVK